MLNHSGLPDTGIPLSRDAATMEFTVENKKLYMLQCRNGKRAAQGCSPASLATSFYEGHYVRIIKLF